MSHLGYADVVAYTLFVAILALSALRRFFTRGIALTGLKG
jgi:hypothetical protein